MASTIEQQAKGSKQGEVRYLTPLDIETKKEAKYCRFKKNGMKYIDYKDAYKVLIKLFWIQRF
jgi:small subunit ribosomal protein S18